MKEAIILAGGLGTRLRAAVPDLPKPMAPVAGRPFLEWLLDYWLAKGVRRFVLSVGYRADVIRAHFGASFRGAEIDYSVEEAPLGTGGGLLLAVARLAPDAPFLVLNGDTLLEVDLRALVASHERHHADATIALIRVASEGRYDGVRFDAGGRIEAFAARGAQYANGGVYLFARRALDSFAGRRGESISLEQSLLPELIGAGARLQGLSCAGRFIDIGVPEDYRRAAAFLAEGATEGESR